jgi:aspartoacylase
MNIKNIAIVGGTHGNEYTGVYLIRKLRLDKIQEQWGDLKIELMIANPKAYEKCVRFIDHDLNRSFINKDLTDLELAGYEANRAKVINQTIGPTGSLNTDLIIDIHTTTTSMGMSIILIDDNLYNLQMAAYIKSKIPNCNIYYISAESYTGDTDHPFLNSLAPYGFTLEVGPIPNGIVRHDIFNKTKSTIDVILEFINMTNSGNYPEISGIIDVFKHKKIVEFPKDKEGNISAIIHENLQDRDYQLLKKGDPIFFTIEGDIITFEEDEILYPVFINEAAYYYKGVAFSLTEKVSLDTKKGFKIM